LTDTPQGSAREAPMLSFREPLLHTSVLKPTKSVVTSVGIRKGRADLRIGNLEGERAG